VENSIIVGGGESKLVSKFIQNYRENVIIESVQYFTSFYVEANDLSNQHMYDLFKLRFVSCMFCVI
jgi:hypothetical protein